MAKKLWSKPDEPPGDCNVIRFEKWGVFYAALGIETYYPEHPNQVVTKWYLTQDGTRNYEGGKGLPPMLWEDLLNWVTVENWATMEILS